MKKLIKKCLRHLMFELINQAVEAKIIYEKDVIVNDLCLRVKNLEDTLDGMRMEYAQYLINNVETQEIKFKAYQKQEEQNE